MKENTKASIGLLSAIFLGVSGIMGSGWLFAPYKAAVLAGPASILSWIIGATLVMLLSFAFAEIASVYPKRGLSAIIPTLSHNKFFGFPFALASWLGVVAVIGLEADATVQYLINLFPNLTYYFFANAQLTFWGNAFSISLVLFYCLVNYWGANLLAKTNNLFTIVKLIVPVITALIVIAVVFHPHNFNYQNSFMPFGFKSVLVALVTSGIIVAFNGFQTIIAFSSEIKNPHRTIPMALTSAILICLVVYLLLQIAFIGALPAGILAEGWREMSMSAPMVELSLMIGLGLLASVIYFGATIAPTGAAIAFTGAATRMFTAMSRREQMPRYFDSVHPVYRVSRPSLVMNIFLAILFVLLFRSWSQLAQVLSLFHLISYIPIPIALVVFRHRVERSRYTYRVPVGYLIAFFLFFVFTYLITLIDTIILTELAIFFAISLIVFIGFNVRCIKGTLLALQKCYSMLLYFVGLVLLAHYSPTEHTVAAMSLHVLMIFVFSLVLFYLMTRLDTSKQMPLRYKERPRNNF